MGELELSPLAFYDMTFYEYSLRMEGYRRRNTEQWRKVRRLYTLVHNLAVKPGDQQTELDLMPLPDDPQPNAEEAAKLLLNLAK